MPITELVFVSYKTDSESVAALKEKESEIFKHFSGVKGLQAKFRGPILEDNGAIVDPKSIRSVLVLGKPYETYTNIWLLISKMIEWDDPASFHDFFPKSDNFQSFVSTIKPLVAAPATPELYEADERSIACTSSPIIQIVKAKAGDETTTAWEKLKVSYKTISGSQPNFYHANGIEKDEGSFLGLIGWNSLKVCVSCDSEKAGI
jgi:hypothetical protein